MEFLPGQRSDHQNRVLLRHFNSGKILAISPNNLPYLQDFYENASGINKESRLPVSQGARRQRLQEDEQFRHVEDSSREDLRGFEIIENLTSLQEGYSVGASRSQSGSSSYSQHSDREGMGDDDRPEMFEFRVEDSFVDEIQEDGRSEGDEVPEFSLNMQENINPTNIQRQEDLIPLKEEPNSAHNDPPIIKKKPIGKR